MSIFKQFKTDTQKEQEGIEVTYAPNEDGSIPTFIVRRRGPSNQRYAKTLERESAPYRRLVELGTLDSAKQEEILKRVFCMSVLVDWKNIQDDKTKEPIPFTFDNAMKLFNLLPDLYYDLAERAGKAAEFRAETLEGDAKNS